MKKILFLDRDGTLIVEPSKDKQVDSLEKLEFIPGVIRNLYRIVTELDYELVMVTNQDGLGTDSFPEKNFLIPHKKMLKTLKGEGIVFKEVLIDSSFPNQKSPKRKPKTGLVKHYEKQQLNIEESFVIGDRVTDIELAKNMGLRGILFTSKNMQSLKSSLKNKGLVRTLSYSAKKWDDIYSYLSTLPRGHQVTRKTKETDIAVSVNLDGRGEANIKTGIGFFDHMLEQLSKHSGCDITVLVKGDLHVDEHHTIEDAALALGKAFRQALGSKRGIERYGFTLPMDDALAQSAIDFSGRSWLIWEAEFHREKIGGFPTEMFYHFFKSFTEEAKCNLNIKASGDIEHHKIEAIFKSVAKSIKMAIKRDKRFRILPSTKGVL